AWALAAGCAGAAGDCDPRNRYPIANPTTRQIAAIAYTCLVCQTDAPVVCSTASFGIRRLLLRPAHSSFRAAQEIPVIQGTPHAILYPRKSVSSRLLPAGWSAAFLRLRRMKSAIRVFFLR